MQKLEPPELHSLSAALGWMELGNLVEARAELAAVGPAYQNHPDVLEVRWAICAEEENWPEALQIARALLHYAPDSASGWLHQAYALRRVPGGSIKSAWHALLPAFDKFPRKYLICYNLSCYACQMKQLDAALTWFKRALVLGGKDKVKQMALEDVDLKDLWEQIKNL